MRWLIACLCYIVYRYITDSCSGTTIPARSEKKAWCESGHFCWLSPCQFLSDWTGARPMFSLCYGTMFLDSFMCCTFPLGYCPRSHGILHAFTAPLVRFHHVLRICTTLLLCPQYVKVICKLSSYCTIHTFYSSELSNELLPSVCICNFIYISTKREVCRPKCISLSLFFFAKEEGCAFITARI